MDAGLTAEKLPFEELKRIYSLRWSIEVNYRFIKRVQKLECFTGTDSLLIRQDVFATLTVWNIATFCRIGSNKLIRMRFRKTRESASGKRRKYSHKTNTGNLIYRLKKNLVKIMLEPDAKKRSMMLQNLLFEASEHTVPLRHGRKFPHKKKHTAKCNNSWKSHI
ncbi:MAG: hypothetical protein LBT59_23475 [Clostridiales bacterium]|jgi:hypothetical protein|nr:hypothetical protein [Clostridiales bacterium]